MCVGKNKNNFSGCFLLNFPKFRFKTAVKIGLQVTFRGFAKWREIEAESFDLDDT